VTCVECAPFFALSISERRKIESDPFPPEVMFDRVLESVSDEHVAEKVNGPQTVFSGRRYAIVCPSLRRTPFVIHVSPSTEAHFQERRATKPAPDPPPMVDNGTLPTVFLFGHTNYVVFSKCFFSDKFSASKVSKKLDETAQNHPKFLGPFFETRKHFVWFIPVPPSNE